MIGYKAITRSGLSPIRNTPIPDWNGELPFTLPKTILDTSNSECSFGWNFCKTIEDVIKITQLRINDPIIIYKVQGSEDTISRETKLRCSELTLLRRATRQELKEALANLHSEETKKDDIAKIVLERFFRWPKTLRNLEEIKHNIINYFNEFNIKVTSINNNNNYNNYKYYNNYYYYYNYNNNNNNYYNYYNNYYYYAFSKFVKENNKNPIKLLLNLHHLGVELIHIQKDNSVIYKTYDYLTPKPNG